MCTAVLAVKSIRHIRAAFSSLSFLDYAGDRYYIYRMDKKFKVSVIIPVYNIQDFLEETLSSVTSQSIGFDDVQLILIDDGSVDATADICLRFRDAHPDNIVYIHQENAGVSAARNRGIEEASGEIVTFLDGDDKWSQNAFETAYSAHLQHPDVAVFSCRMNFFDLDSGEHQLNYKYSEDIVVDITEAYNYPQLSSSSVFIRNDILRNYRYTEGIKYSEDCRFINEILLDSRKMMMLSRPVYWYRKRSTNDSAIQRSLSDSDYYLPVCRDVYRYLFDRSVSRYGEVLKYIQFVVMYDLRWRLKVPLSESAQYGVDTDAYYDSLVSLLRDIDDSIILEQKRIALALQLYALELKHGGPITDMISSDEKGRISYGNNPVFDIAKQNIIFIDSVSPAADSFVIRGEINLPFSPERFSVGMILDDQYEPFELNPSDNNVKTYLKGVLKSNQTFTAEGRADYSAGSSLTFCVGFDSRRFTVTPKYRTHTGLDKREGALSSDGHEVRRKGSCLQFSKSSLLRSLFSRLK